MEGCGDWPIFYLDDALIFIENLLQHLSVYRYKASFSRDTTVVCNAILWAKTLLINRSMWIIIKCGENMFTKLHNISE